MTQPKSSLQLTLFQAENEAVQYIQYAMVEHANALIRALARKDLPMFYFTEAGEGLGIPAKTCRSWKINSWPAANRPGDEKLLQKVAIYIQVYQRLSKYPSDETYADAAKRLQRRINELREKRFSHNQISQYARISFRTLKDIQTKDPEPSRRRNHCPWNLLERLEDAEAGMLEQREQQEQFKDNRIPRSGPGQSGPGPKPASQAGPDPMERGGRCLKCGEPWSNLRYDGEDAWGREIMVCIICANENPVSKDPPPADPPDMDEAGTMKPGRHEFVERYEPCRKCKTPWHNLKKDRVDRWGNTVYICLRCASLNLVRPKAKKTRVT